MKNRLIIVEGLPGSGKSTMASRIADKLKNSGVHSICFDEGMPGHPADYDDYDFPDFETERNMILSKWREFVNSAENDTVYVFNCIFLQNPMCETMMRFGMDKEASGAYISEIAGIIKEMSPVILYIDVPDVKLTVDSVLNERGEQWLNAVIDYHCGQGYGKANCLSGYEGYIKCLEERRNRELYILNNLDTVHHIVSRDITDDELMKYVNT